MIIKYRDKNAAKISKNMLRKILMLSYDRKVIRRNRSEKRNILARLDILQIIINHDIQSRDAQGRQLEKMLIAFYVFDDVKNDEVVS